MTNTADDVKGFDDAPKKPFRMPKWGIVTLAIIAVLVVIALIIPSFLDQSKYKDLIIQKVADQTGYTVSWEGDLGISVLPVPHVTIHQATVSNGAQKILSIKQADISVELAPLLNKQVQVSSVKFVEPEVTLVVDQAGRQTWMTDKLQAEKSESESQSKKTEVSKQSAQSFTLDSIEIEKGQIVYKDLSKGSTQEVSNLNTNVKLKDLTGPFDIKADLNYNGNDISIKGEAGKLVESKPTDINADIELPKLEVKGNYKGKITTGDVLIIKGDLKLSAKDTEKTLSALSRKETKLPKGLNGALDLSSSVLFDGDNAALDNIAVSLGELAYKGAVKVGGLKTSQTPKLNIDLVSTKKSNSDVALVKSLSELSVKGVGTYVHNTATIDNGIVTYGGIQYSNINLSIVNNPNALTINKLFFNTVADTSVSAAGIIGNIGKLSNININLNAKTRNIEQLAKAYNKPLNLQQQVGAASVSGNFRGSLENLGFNATVDALGFAVTGVGNVKSVNTTPQLENLNLRARHASLQSAVRNFSPKFNAPGNFNGPLDVATTLAMKDKKYDLTNIKGSLGSTTVGGKLFADMSGQIPSVTGDLAFGSMVFDSAQPQAGTAEASGKPSSTPASTSESRWSKEAIDTAWMNKFNADISIKAASITQGLWRLVNANLAFKLNGGVLDIKNMDANVFGGNVAINGNMKGGTSPLSMNWTAKAENINAQQMLSAVQNKQSDTLSGTIKSFDMNIAASGNSAAALVSALSGKGSANGNNLVIKGVDAAKLADAAKGSYKPLERAGSLFNSFKDGQTSFTDFDAAFDISGGIINFTQLKFDGPQATLNSKGQVNLPRWTVDLKNNMTVKNSEVPPFDFTIKGPLDNPLQAGSGVIEGFLRQKAQEKVGKLIEDKLGKKLGIPAGILSGGNAAPEAETAPAATMPVEPADDGTQATPEAVPLTKEQKKQKQIEEGVKTLQGLFGQ